jgi:methyltransferase (TIGR00027 family)
MNFRVDAAVLPAPACPGSGDGLAQLTRGPLLAFACLMLAPSFVWGVPAGAAAWSADMVCMLRAIASQHPDALLRNPDTLAQRLCPRPFELRDYAAARAQFAAAPEAWAGYYYVNARTHHIDAAVERAVLDGASQVVILGAGFDSRAYRMHAAHPALQFYEVDLPAVVAAKKQRLAQAFIVPHERVAFAAVDFDRQTLADVLPRLGYDAQRKTLFILEGVTMYISEAGSGATLDFVRRHSGQGSRIVYDYLLRDALDGERERYHGIVYAARMLAAHGEPFTTGWSEPDAAAFAAAHGLQLIDDIGADDLAMRYLMGSDGRLDGRWLQGSRIIEARVP